MTAFKHIFNNYLELSIVIFLWIFLPLHLCAQACDLQHDFKVTRSSGQIPNIFLHAIDGEIEKNIPNDATFSDKEKQEYAGFCKHTLSSIIKTGDLLFGDPMTQFVEKVGRRLLEKSEIPYSKYDFFVLKSHHTNALALEPGVIIVTTGLLSQIENEAQLAFVLSHEIAHLRANHLLKSYAHKEENINDDSFGFLQLAQMAKDFEVEADCNAVSIYQRAGYDQNEIDKTFLVLMYSYLPFDEVKIDSSFFNNANVYIPSSYFPDSPNPIVAFEEYTDVYSTHPNLKTRKAEIAQEVKKFENWESKLRFFDEAEFVKVRDIARFENMRQNHLKGYYIKTLYESSLLRNKYPENIYLAEIQASAWVQLHKIFLLNNKRNYFKNTNRAEGAMSMLYQFFMRLNAEELGALSMRMIEDLRIAFRKANK